MLLCFTIVPIINILALKSSWNQQEASGSFFQLFSKKLFIWYGLSSVGVSSESCIISSFVRFPSRHTISGFSKDEKAYSFVVPQLCIWEFKLQIFLGFSIIDFHKSIHNAFTTRSHKSGVIILPFNSLLIALLPISEMTIPLDPSYSTLSTWILEFALTLL